MGELEGFVPSLEAAQALRRDADGFVADLAKAGVDRLLGGGTVARTWKVYVAHASKHAREKVTVLDAPPDGGTAPAVP